MRRPPASRRLIAVLLALLLGALAAAPHRHAGDSLDLFRAELPAGTIVHDIACAEPTALHWHADHAVEVEPCLACLRNHLAGLLSIETAPSISADVTRPPAATSPHSLLRVPDANFSRGPPGLPS